MDDYITALLQPNFVLDQVRIFLFARMYHIHIAIVLNDRFLCTNRDNDLQKCEIFLGYFGRMWFVDTRPIKWDRETLESLTESDDSIEIPQTMRRTPIKPKDPRPPKPQKNFGVSKPTKRQLALLAAKESPKCSKVDSTTENELEPEKDSENKQGNQSVKNSESDHQMEKDSDNEENSEQGSQKNFATKIPGAKFGNKNPKSSKVISTNKGDIKYSVQ